MQNFNGLVKLEPELRKIEECARNYRHSKTNREWYDIIKPQIVSTVGHYRQKPGPNFLFTCEAYDIAYQHLSNIYGE